MTCLPLHPQVATVKVVISVKTVENVAGFLSHQGVEEFGNEHAFLQPGPAVANQEVDPRVAVAPTAWIAGVPVTPVIAAHVDSKMSGRTAK